MTCPFLELTLQIKEPSYNIQENAGMLTVTVIATGETVVPISGRYNPNAFKVLHIVYCMA